MSWEPRRQGGMSWEPGWQGCELGAGSWSRGWRADGTVETGSTSNKPARRLGGMTVVVTTHITFIEICFQKPTIEAQSSGYKP